MIALFPGPLKREDDTNYEHACARLGQARARIGFEPYNNGTWILDPGTTALTMALRHERERLQHHRWNATLTAKQGKPWTDSTISHITLAKSIPHPHPCLASDHDGQR